MGQNYFFESHLEIIFKINYLHGMKNLNFSYIGAWNFLCFGPQGIEIKFGDYGKVVFIRGENRDVKKEDEMPSDEVRVSSNGSGKSSIQEIIVYGLYGKSIKKPSAILKDGVINNIVGKDCKIDLMWDKYRVVRTRKKNSLRFWESVEGVWDESTELTTGSMDDTQSLIEESIGLTYEAFVNICIFTDDQSASFLEAGSALKREIVENLLSLSSYREKQDKAKRLVSETTSGIKMLSKEYELLKSSEDESFRRLNQAIKKESDWKAEKSKEIESINLRISEKKSQLANSSHGGDLLAYNEAQARIKECGDEISTHETAEQDARDKIDATREKDDKLRDMAQTLKGQAESVKSKIAERQQKIKTKRQHIDSVRSNEHGSTCEVCYGVIDVGNIQKVVDSDELEISAINGEISPLLEDAKKLSSDIVELPEKMKKVKDFLALKESLVNKVVLAIRDLRREMSDLAKIREPKADSRELLLNQEIEQLQESMSTKTNELNSKSPYEDIISSENESHENAKITSKSKHDSIKDSEDNLKYYQYWNQGFGEKGIRKTVVDGIIPQLNNRIDYWLQFLIENKIVLRFDNEFNEIIERNPPDGDPFIYHAMSAGQRRRLNLSVSQAFADVMMISSGTIPSVVFLDEVTTNIDPLGVQGIFNMIQELSLDKQVFITTHDKDLIRMLETSDVIDLVHEKGFTVIKK